VANLQAVLELVRQLSLLDKVRLIEEIAPQIERELEQAPTRPRTSLCGLCADLGSAPSAEDIDTTRQEERASLR